MRIANTECFDDIAMYTVEFPVREHKRLKIVEAENTELENLEIYEMFEEVEDEGHEIVGSK